MSRPGHASLPRLLRRLWRWSWLLTLPVAAFFLVWLEATGSRFAEFGLRYQLFFEPPSLLQRIGKMEMDHTRRGLGLAMGREPDLGRAGLRQLYLFVEESQLEQLDRNLPHSGRSYVEAWLRYPDGNLNEVKLKYRGDFYYHWAYHKKSLRIRTKKKRLFEGMRSINLIAPKFPTQLNNYLAYELADAMGLLAPRHEMVNLWLNGRNQGLYLLVEQLEESMLRNARRMPGDLYRGELVARDSYRGITNNLFLHPRLWEKVAVNNHYPEDSFAPMEALIRALEPARSGECSRLREVLDVGAWGRFLAFETLTQSFHYGNSHNWRLYYDPARGVFEPVVWDPDGWHPIWMPKAHQRARADVRSSDLHDRLLANHELLLARQEAIEDFFAANRDRLFLATVEKTVGSVASAVERDPHQVFQFEALRPAEVMDRIQRLRRDVERVFVDIREAYLDGGSDLRYGVDRATSKIELTVTGRRPLHGLRLEYARPVGAAVGATLGYVVKGRREEVDVSGAASVRGATLAIDVPLLASFVPFRSGRQGTIGKDLKLEPGYYELSLEGLPPGSRLLGLSGRFRDGTRVAAGRVAEVKALEFRGADVVACPRPVEVAEIWHGEKHVDGVVTVGDLILRPGTTIRLSPGASLFVEGRLVAEGTKDQPIRFLPAVEGQEPWGAVVLRGPGADGSSLRHCELAYGSGYKSDLLEFSAMLSIHDVRGVTLSHCRLHDNRVVDDMLHVVYGDIEINNSVFENALFDAIDLDVVDASVSRSVFRGSGNDALDLMTSNVMVTGSRFHRAADKGISVGEGTTLVAIDNLLRDNQIGLEAKDASRAYVFNSTFEGNGKALNAYAKNWRYGRGGEIDLYFSSLSGDGEAATAEKRSRIRLSASEVPAALTPSKRLVIAPGERETPELPGFARRIAWQIDPRRIGSKTHGN